MGRRYLICQVSPNFPDRFSLVDNEDSLQGSFPCLLVVFINLTEVTSL